MLSDPRNLIIVVLAVLLLLSGALLKHEVTAFAEFKGEVAAAGKKALEDKERLEAEHDKVLKDVSVAWKDAMDSAVASAVSRARARFGGLCNSGSGLMPRPSGNDQGNAGGGEEPVAVSPGFVRDCAKDAAALDVWVKWANDNRIPVKEQ